MCIKTDHLPVLTLNDFNANNVGFVFLSLNDFGKNKIVTTQSFKTSFLAIIFCKKESGEVMIDSNDFILRNATIISIGLSSVCRFKLDPRTEGYIVLFSEAFFYLEYNNTILYHFFCLRAGNCCYKTLEKDEIKVWNFYFNQILQLYLSKSNQSISLLKLHLNIVLSMLDNVGQTIENQKKRSYKNEKVIDFENLVEQHFISQRLPSFYASALHISVNYLNRICKEIKGLSSGEIIRKRILLEAVRLLLHTTKTVKEIADELGFESISYFSTFFKKHTGVSPNRFLKNNK